MGIKDYIFHFRIMRDYLLMKRIKLNFISESSWKMTSSDCFPILTSFKMLLVLKETPASSIAVP